jgi:type IV pilus assembly protein PilE
MEFTMARCKNVANFPHRSSVSAGRPSETRLPGSSRRKKVSGFTLIELMTVAVIIAVLAAIGYPTYLNQSMKGRRSNAEALLMDMAQREQQYFLDARTYAATVATLNVTVPTTVSNFYNLTIVTAAGPPPTFTLTATPIAGSAQATDVTLTIDNTGAKTPANVW